ncbi:MAG: ABC transporter ATP-binding protein [Armatimonadota bacterium]
MNQQKTCSIELHNIYKTYRSGMVETPVLHDINLTVSPGEFAAVVGPSGSGKSTLLNIIGLLDTPDEGELALCGRNVAQIDEQERVLLRREYVGFIFQLFYLLPEFTVLENALMPTRLKSREAEIEQRERVINLLQRVGMGNRLNHLPSQLSGGEQQRVAIVRALANDPVVVLADEPTGTLDTRTGETVFNLMYELSKTTGKSFLMVTHDERLAAKADRQIHLVDGRVTD